MRTPFLVAVGLAAGFACGPQLPPDTECVRNTDCSRGRLCLDGLCVDAVAGGVAGGGSAGGAMVAGGSVAGGVSGGSVSGGGTAGGLQGGGSAGGGSAGGSSGGASAGGMSGGQAGGVSAGGPGGGSAGGVGDGGSCLCSDAEECVGGLVCVARYALLQWRAPSPNATFDVTASVRLEAALVVAAGRTRNDPAQLPFVATSDAGAISGTLALIDAGLYAQTASFPEGQWSATVSFPDAGLVDGPLPFTVRSASFEVSWAPPPLRLSSGGLSAADPLDDGTFFRRNELTTVVVSNAAGATNVTVSVQGILADGGSPLTSLATSAPCPACVGRPGFCECYSLDLARPDFDAFRGRFGFTVTGTVGITTVTQTSQTHPARLPTLPVTRWKWALRRGDDAGTFFATGPVLDPAGNVIASFTRLDGGVRDDGVASVSPAGAIRWVSRAGNATTDLVLLVGDAGAQVFYGSQTRGYVGLQTSTGDGGVSCTAPTNAVLSGSSATVLGFGAEIPATMATVPPSTNLLVFPLGSGGTCAAQSLPAAGPLVGNAGTLFVMNNLVRQISSHGVFGGGSGTIPYPAGVTSISQLVPAGVVFGAFVGSGGGIFTTTPTNVFSASAAGAGALSTTDYWVPVASALPSGAQLMRFPLTSWSPVTITPLAGQLATVSLGRSGYAYVATDLGQLLALRGDAVQWTVPTDARLGGPVTTTLLLDCERDQSGAKLGGRPGVAYLVAGSLQLQAIITDSAGLDVTQPWPMHRHDPRGTNNSATSLADFACP